MSFGFFFALLAGFFKSGKSLTAKLASTGTNEYTATFFMRLITGIVLFSLILFFGKFASPKLNPKFIISLSINTILLGTIAVLLNQAYKLADTSLVAPLVGITPIMTILPTYILLDDKFTIVGVLGVLMTGVGAFVILSDGNFSLNELRSSISEPGIKSIIAFLLLVGFVPAIDKIGIQNSSPLTWSFMINFFSGLLILLFSVITDKFDGDHLSVNNLQILFLFGIFNSGIWVGQSFAYELMNPSYVQAIKRSSIILTVFIGSSIYNEEGLIPRLVGSICIITGTILLIISVTPTFP